MSKNEGIQLVDRDESGVDIAFREDVVKGLSQERKALPARWLYDDAGSQLFEDITKVPEYYPTRCETEILQDNGEEFLENIGTGLSLIHISEPTRPY